MTDGAPSSSRTLAKREGHSGMTWQGGTLREKRRTARSGRARQASIECLE